MVVTRDLLAVLVAVFVLRLRPILITPIATVASALSAMTNATPIDVRHEPEHSRRVATIGGMDCVVRYRVVGDVMQVLSTNVPPALEGRGIAAALMRAALADAEARRLQVDPLCSYTAA